MNKKNIRSEYIKKLMEDKNAISAKLEETTKETLKEILGESVNKELRNILSESDKDDEFEEEEVSNTEDSVLTDEPEEKVEDETTEIETVEDDAEVDDVDVESVDDLESSDNTEGDDVWGELESVKDENGEYDLTGMDKDKVLKVLKVMKPEDGVRVVKNDDNSITLTDTETDKEYIIDIEDEIENNEDDEFEFEIIESVDNNFVVDDYQSDDAISGLTMNEPANPKTTHSIHRGIPNGTEKPFPGDLNEEEYVIEAEIDEIHSSLLPVDNSTVQTHKTNKVTRVGRHNTEQGTSTSDSPYQPKGKTDESLKLENIKRKANVIFNENKQLKDILSKLKTKLEESIVINASLGKIVQLVTENTTSRDEKVNIVKRFNEVKTIQESRELYNTISNELKLVHNNPKTVVNETIDKQISEGKNNNIIETSIYKSTDLSNTLDLMNRMMNLS